jgi:hypothetical protein
MMKERSYVPKIHFWALWFAAVLLFTLPLSNANAVVSNRTIDGWTVDQPTILDALRINFPVDPVGTIKCNTLAGLPPLQTIGGERDMQDQLLGATDSGAFNIHVSSVSQHFVYSQDPGIFGTSWVQWDGGDASCVLNPIGLGGIDLVVDGDRISFDIVSLDHIAIIIFNAYTDAFNYSTYQFIQPAYTPELKKFKFTDFAIGGGTGADFSNIGALELIVTPQSSDGELDMTLGPIITQCPTCTCNSFTATPSSILFGQTTTLNWSLSTDPALEPLTAQIDNGIGPIVTPTGSVVTAPLFASTTFHLTAETICHETCPCEVPVTVGECACPVVNNVTAPSSWGVGGNVHLCWDTTPFDAIPTVVHVDAPGYGPGVDLPEDGCIDFVADKLNYCVDAVNGCVDAPNCHKCVSSTPHTIPTLSGWGVGVLLLLMAVSALWLLKRKKAIG